MTSGRSGSLNWLTAIVDQLYHRHVKIQLSHAIGSAFTTKFTSPQRQDPVKELVIGMWRDDQCVNESWKAGDLDITINTNTGIQ